MTEYAIFRFYAPYPPTSVLVTPVGVALWDTKAEEFSVKFIKEHAQNLTDGNVRLVNHIERNMNYYFNEGLPYPHGGLKPFEHNFWVLMKDRLVHCIRLSEPGATVDKVSDIDNFFDRIIYNTEGFL